jgi:hypothetical protein
MARGWESKSVEHQQAELADRAKPSRPPLSASQQKRARERDGLLLIRARLQQQIQASTQPQHRRMLEHALAEIDQQLSSFEQAADPPRT